MTLYVALHLGQGQSGSSVRPSQYLATQTVMESVQVELATEQRNDSPSKPGPPREGFV